MAHFEAYCLPRRICAVIQAHSPNTGFAAMQLIAAGTGCSARKVCGRWQTCAEVHLALRDSIGCQA